MPRGSVTDAPEFNVAVFSFLLHYIWEFWQVPFYAGMPGQEHWSAIQACSRAVAGDVAIALASFGATAAILGSRRWMLAPRPMAAVLFISIGLAITIVLELLATRVWGRWTYADSMPIVPLIGVGLLPVLQWIVVPLLVMWFVRRQRPA